MPPALPVAAAYNSHYCEENCYLLAETFIRDPSVTDLWEVYVIFISNHTKTARIHPAGSVALWNQKLTRESGLPVVWDYHVITVLRPRQSSPKTQSWVYDFDTELGIPVTWDTYLARTFSSNIPDTYQSIFRAVPANILLDRFASDRSHMIDMTALDSTPKYLKPPPTYPALQGKLCGTITHNLMDFVSMLATDGYGDVKDMLAISEFLGQSEEES